MNKIGNIELDSRQVTTLQVVFYALIILSIFSFNDKVESVIDNMVLINISILSFLSLSFAKDSFILDINSCSKSLIDSNIIGITNIITFIILSIEFGFFVSFIYLISLATFFQVRKMGLEIRKDKV